MTLSLEMAQRAVSNIYNFCFGRSIAFIQNTKSLYILFYNNYPLINQDFIYIYTVKQNKKIWYDFNPLIDIQWRRAKLILAEIFTFSQQFLLLLFNRCRQQYIVNLDFSYYRTHQLKNLFIERWRQWKTFLTSSTLFTLNQKEDQASTQDKNEHTEL